MLFSSLPNQVAWFIEYLTAPDIKLQKAKVSPKGDGFGYTNIFALLKKFPVCCKHHNSVMPAFSLFLQEIDNRVLFNQASLFILEF